MFADARNTVGAIELVRDIDWPPRAVTTRVLDLDGREVRSGAKGGETTRSNRATTFMALGKGYEG